MDTALAQILARLDAAEAAIGEVQHTIEILASGRSIEDEPQLQDRGSSRQPRRTRAGPTRAPPPLDNEPPVDPAHDRRLTKRAVAEREGCSPRTIDRRLKQGTLPPPDIINGRLYWWLSALQRHEREHKQSKPHVPKRHYVRNNITPA